eukprot:g31832.t1
MKISIGNPHSPGEIATWLLEGQGVVYLSYLVYNSGRAAILLAPHFQLEIFGFNDPEPGCLLHLMVRLGGVVLHFVNVYTRLVRVRQTHFFEEVSTHFTSIDEGQCDILRGWQEKKVGGNYLHEASAIKVLLLKKGDLCSLKNWRPVSSLSVDYKTFLSMLSSRLGS